MTPPELASIYRAYIACLNARDWPELGRFVHDQVRHNGNRIGLAGYRQMLENDYATIPDLHFEIELLVSEPPHVASRLRSTARRRAVFSTWTSTGGRSRSPRTSSMNSGTGRSSRSIR